ncbi:MAG: hypothetical protein CVU56_15975 [Deltaproteobacteria bacterium HGW-Deltaproteobacteria-14]|jgi:hypothetical protein|nr:MAG: hypothetical protein CVU56_15975 [Deltaproteobacteria bacterium HGW-Deltaproteobacteria-14]
MNLRQTLALTVSISTLAAAPALAASGAPSDADLLGARTVGVLPILATGASAAGAWQRVGVAIGDDSRGGVRAPGVVAVQLAADRGFGFAGSATADDMRVLRYGYYLGLMPAVIQSGHAQRREMAAKLLASTDAIAALGPEIRDAVVAALSSLDSVDGAAFARVLAGAQLGLAEGDARKNGYLAAGMWLGLTTLALWQGEADETLVGMAEPLAALLDEDAAFGAADREVAAIVRRVAAELRQPRVDAQRVLEMTGEVLQVQAD